MQTSAGYASEDSMLARHFRSSIWLAQTFGGVQRFWKFESIAKKDLTNCPLHNFDLAVINILCTRRLKL
jgi:hypothetical protein